MKAGQQELADFLQQHYNAELGVNLRYTLMLSFLKYYRLRHLLSSIFVKEKWERLSFNGVFIPKLPGRCRLEQHVQGIKQLFSLQISKNGLCASADLRFIMAKSILTSIQEGFYQVSNGQVLTSGGNKVSVEMLYDSATQHKGNLFYLLRLSH